MAEIGYYVVPTMSDENLGQNYILVNDIYVRHTDLTKTRGRSKKYSSPQSEVIEYIRGTLLKEVLIVRGDKVEHDADKILCKNPEKNTFFHCDLCDVKPVESEYTFNLLLAIPNCRERYDIFHNPIRLAEGLEMDMGMEVLVKIHNTPGEVLGIIQFKGEIKDKDGIYFGIELRGSGGECKGNTNGTWGKQRYFQCNQDCGIFLPLNRVRPVRSRSRSPIAAPRRTKVKKPTGATISRSQVVPNDTCPNTYGITEEELGQLAISHGMEVIIFTEVNGQESQEKGRVKFIGRLPGTNSNEIHAGIDLNKPVGNGTGLYNSKHLFYTKQDHAALVPLSGVLPSCNLSEDILENNHVYESIQSSSRRPIHERGVPTRRQYHTEERSTNKKTFVPASPRLVNSSPAKLSVKSNRVPNSYPGHRSPRGLSPKPPEEPMDMDLLSREQATLNNARTRLENHTAKSRPGRHSANANHSLFRENSDNNSDDELNSQVDLYGSDDKPPSKIFIEKKDIYSNNSSNRLEVSSLNDHRSRITHSLPGHAVNSTSRHSIAPRTSNTAPGIMIKNKSRKEETAHSSQIAQLIDLNSIKHEITNNDDDYHGMEIGTMVEVTEGINEEMQQCGPIYGVIKWIGKLPSLSDAVAGVELERAFTGLSDGALNRVQYFSCPYERGIFVYLRFCKRDPRFSAMDLGPSTSSAAIRPLPNDFGNFVSPEIKGAVPPPRKLQENMIGKRRGIQGHHNSCYLDSTLFSLFAYSQVLDTILFREKGEKDLPEYEETQRVLKELIINPLRENNFVRADRIMQLRQLLDKLGSVTGMVSEEKDPEEFLNTLLVQVFKADPLFELHQGDSNAAHEGFFYQIFTDKDERMGIPSSQQLLEKSLISADLKFANVPVCLILQMPRFGKDYKMYKRLRPSLTMDVTDLVEDLPRTCDICEGAAEIECRDCFLEGGVNNKVLAYCKKCCNWYHKNSKRRSHSHRPLKVPEEFRDYVNDMKARDEPVVIERQTLELFAVVCIATSHYVSFAKCGRGKEATWCFFDSMADRVGEQSGYNIPEITHCPEVDDWLNWDENTINEYDDKTMPELMRRLLCDSYMCMYQSTELMWNK